MAAKSVAVDIRQAPDRVFVYMTDSSNRPKWDPTMSDMQQTSAGPKGVGTTYRITYRMMGMNQVWNVSITKYDVNEALGFAMAGRSMAGDQSVTLAPSGDGTRLTFTTELRVRGVARLAAPFLRSWMNRTIKANAFRLKALLES